MKDDHSLDSSDIRASVCVLSKGGMMSNNCISGESFVISG